MAEDFYERKVCKVVFQAWLLYRFLGLKKSLMQRQADVFSENRILKNSLTLWMHSLRESVEQKRKTGDALWFWSVTLQMRCFEGWKAYTLVRLHKKRRFTQALEIRTHNMLTHGCTQILRYHSDKLATRSKMASRLQSLSNHTQQHLAWKYGTRWLHKTRHRREERKFHTIRSWSPDPPTDVWMNVAPTPPVLVATSPEPKIRAAPRLPDFLDESLNREGLLLGKYSTYRITDDGNESADLNLLKQNADSQSTLQSRQLLEPNSQILLPPSAFTLNHENPDRENDHHHENANAAENIHDIHTNLYPGWKGHDHDNFCENRIVVHENVHEEQGTHHGDHELDHACKLLHTQQHIPDFYHPHKKGNQFHHGYDKVHGMLSHDTFSGYHHGDHGPEKWVKSRKISRDSIGNSGDGIHDTSSSNSSTHDVSRTPEFPYEPTTQLHPTSQTFIVTSQCDDPSLTYIASRDDTSYGSSSPDSSKTFVKFSPRGVHHGDNSPFMKFHETSCDTSKTFIKQASPKQSRDSVHKELKSIHKELQEFQSLKQQLRILKQQQNVMLESYERNTMDMLPSTSLDFNVVENELKQISSEIDGISKTLISKKPEIENLALRVRVLSSRPSC